MKKQSLAVLVIFVIVVFTGINIFLMSSLREGTPETGPLVIEKQENIVKERKPQQITGELTRLTYLDPSREFSGNIISAETEEVARFKSRGEEIFDVVGVIPDGRISFRNVTKGTYGNEYFQDGRREGLYQEYFSNGQLYLEKNYFYGKVLNMKEYYVSGQLRMEIDYRDALRMIDENETGEGKIYFSDGVTMYEWHMTASDANRYKKAYNYKGELVETQYFDEQGKLINKKQARVRDEG